MKNMNSIDVIGGGILNLTSITLGSLDITQILNLVLVIISIILLLVRTGFLIYDKIKNKKYDEIDDVIDDTMDGLDDIVKKDDDNTKGEDK